MLLINDKPLIISTAGNRKATVWNPQTMMWSDFINRVSNPTRSLETIRQYKSMKKSQQDNLKDVGGYVGGILDGNRRKNANLLNRCLITLDADSISAGETHNVIKRVSALGCAYVIYSTRKHESSAPRLRIVFPVDRDISAEEYEPVARKMAEFIGMELFDPTTFQGIRFMYWASICADGEWVFQYEDKPFLNVDGLLARYQDWKDVTKWTEVPGARKKIEHSISKQGNPQEKNGVIGAFCRIYDVPAAIDKFLPDIYEDCGNGRYTYREGSTAAGAVIYDKDQFLYSNHATDPAGGRLNNSFDLVRIHKFGRLDDDVVEGMPVNRLPSFKAMYEFSLQDEIVKHEHIKKVFGVKEIEKEAYPDIKLNTNGAITILPTAQNLETLLRNEGIAVSYDLIKREIKVNSKNKYGFGQTSPNSYHNLLVHCTDQLARDGLRTSTTKVHEWIMKIADDNTENVAKQYLENNLAQWNGTTGVESLFQCLIVDGNEDFYRVLLRKWLCQCVAMAHNEKGEYGADGVLVLKGPHGIGKTSFLRMCCVIGLRYFIEGASFDGSKDKLMESISGWIGEMGELPRSLKDLNGMKAFITSATDTFRTPYGKKAEVYPRLISFGATTNDDIFLKEEGERRFWVIDVSDIDLKAMEHINYDNVWGEVMQLYEMLGHLSFRLTKEERSQLKKANKKYLFASEEETMLLEKLDWDQPREEWKEFTATALVGIIGVGKGLSTVKIGRALRRIGYEKDCKEYPMRMKDGISLYRTPSKVLHPFEFMM